MSDVANMIQINTNICTNICKLTFFLSDGSINTFKKKKLRFSGNYFMVHTLKGWVGSQHTQPIAGYKAMSSLGERPLEEGTE